MQGVIITHMMGVTTHHGAKLLKLINMTKYYADISVILFSPTTIAK